jgi:hypothetical protein
MLCTGKSVRAMPTMRLQVPAGVSEDAAREALTLLARHREVLRRISDLLAEPRNAIGPDVLAQLGRVEELWRRIESRWGLLDADQVTRLTGGNPAKARSHVANLRRRKGLLGVRRHGSSALRYPGFQFTHGGSVRPEWARAAEVLVAAGWTSEEIVLWAGAPTGWLDGETPLEVLDTDPDAVVEAARTIAAGISA